MLLEVEVDGEPWLADVGFGCSGPLYPIRLREGEPDRQGVWSFRMRREGDEFVLQSKKATAGSTSMRSPESRSTRSTTRSAIITHQRIRTRRSCRTWWFRRVVLHSRVILRNRELTELKPGEPETTRH